MGGSQGGLGGNSEVMSLTEPTAPPFNSPPEAGGEGHSDGAGGAHIYPWGDERGTIARLVEMMTEHDVEHRDEIVKAIQSGK